MRKGRRRNKKKKKRTTGFGLLTLLTICLCAVVLYASANLKKERDDKLVVKEQLERQIAEMQTESQKLDVKKDYIGTKKFVEEMARKVLGLVYPNEIVFEEKGEGED